MPELTFPLRSEEYSQRNPIGSLDGYSILQSFGKEHLFPVYLALDKFDNQLVVLKIMDPSETSFMNEASIFKTPNHDKIVRCKKLIENGKFSINDAHLSFKDKMKLTNAPNTSEPSYLLKNALVLELAPYGDLFNFLLCGPLPESITRDYMGQLIDAIEHLHSNGYCHADLKLENILVDEDFKIKLTDFGFSCNVFERKMIEKKTGTPSYRPPEMWAEDFKGHDGILTDIFQLGVILFILQTGMRPFHVANNSDSYYKAVLAGRWDVFWTFKQREFKARKVTMLSDDLKKLLAQMMSAKSEDRPSLAEIKSSDWFTKTQPASEEEVAAEMKRRVGLMG